MFRWDIVSKFLFSDIFLQAAWTTLWVAVVAQAIGVILGLFIALMRMSRFRLLRWPSTVYVWFFRGSPLLVQLLLLWDGIPRLTQGALLPSEITSVLIAFSLNEAAYMSEIIRAGISSVDAGQMEAAKSLGMRYVLAMRRIIMPQAARVIVPPLGNEFNNMLKTTSIASVIGLVELTQAAEIYGSPTFTIFELLIVATFYYLIMTTIWTFLQQWIERRLNPDSNVVQDETQTKGWTQRMFGINLSRVR